MEDQGPLAECEFCHRKFFPERLAKHQGVCEVRKAMPVKRTSKWGDLEEPVPVEGGQARPGEGAGASAGDGEGDGEGGGETPPGDSDVVPTPVDVQLEPCPHCGRTFFPDRLPKHLGLCPLKDLTPEQKQAQRAAKRRTAPITKLKDKLSSPDVFEEVAAEVQAGNNNGSSSHRQEGSERSDPDFAGTFVPCPKCGRTFFPDRLQKHADRCQGDDKGRLRSQSDGRAGEFAKPLPKKEAQQRAQQKAAGVSKPRPTSPAPSATAPASSPVAPTKPLASPGKAAVKGADSKPEDNPVVQALGALLGTLALIEGAISEMSEKLEERNKQDLAEKLKQMKALQELDSQADLLGNKAGAAVSQEKPPAEKAKPKATKPKADYGRRGSAGRAAVAAAGRANAHVARVFQPKRDHAKRPILVYKGNKEEASVLGEVLVALTTTLADFRELVRAELGLPDEFEIYKVGEKLRVPISEKQQHYRVQEFFREETDVVVVRY